MRFRARATPRIILQFLPAAPITADPRNCCLGVAIVFEEIAGDLAVTNPREGVDLYRVSDARRANARVQVERVNLSKKMPVIHQTTT